MKIAIASGKGGTGKTMVTASLAVSWQRSVKAVDLDVEEPNLHLFLKPDISKVKNAYMEVPGVDQERCNYCGECSEICQFKAISVFDPAILVFPEMCHGCGGCIAICPQKAIVADQRLLGEISWGTSGIIDFFMGRLRVGEAMSPPLIRQVLAQLPQQDSPENEPDILLDSPPGVSCPAVSAVMESDFILLVTEPTPFGLFDLRLAHQAFIPLGKPMGVVINRSGLGGNDVYRFCQKAQLPILAEIPYQRAFAEAYAKGEIIAQCSDEMAQLFRNLADRLLREAISPSEVHHA